MSDGKDPFDPFGRSERTIIRPNPGGRRPQPAATPSPYPAPGYTPPPPAGFVPVQPSGPFQPPPPAGGFGGLGEDAWAAAPVPAPYIPAPEAPRAIPAESAPSPYVPLRDMPFPPSDNPILGAAAPILMLLGRLRVSLAQASFSLLMEQVAAAITRFEKQMTELGVGQDHSRQARYAVCATADDIVQNIPTHDRQLWTQYSMLSRFFGERTGGIRFFEELDRAKVDPILNYNVLELQHACLALGFQGVHRTSAGGQATLQTIQRNLYETLRRVKPRTVEDLSPRWRGQALAARLARIRIPVWAVASLAGLLLLAIYLTLRSLLSGGTGALLDDMGRIFPTTDVVIERRVVVPAKPAPPPAIKTTQLDRIRAALEPEIGAQKLIVDGTSTSIVIRVGSFVSFQPGQATVIEEFKPLAAKIAKVLNDEAGPVRVTGHSDNTPIRSVRFASNHELSVERAKAVAALLSKDLKDPRRIETDGKGDTAPIASNDTVEGRARNRRVDVQIPHAR